MKNKNRTAALVIKSVALSYIITIVLLLILAFILYKFELPASKIRIGVVVVYIVSNLIGGFYIGRKKGVKKYLWGALSAAAYLLVLLAVSLVVSQSMGQDITGIVSAVAACIGGGAVGGMIS